ncbi:MAG: PD-(D/E)XK nuclease family protein [Chloroflexota bacterium]
MAIPSDFQFSQASLQDFVDCRRRFYYRNIQRLAWPALEAEPALANEQWMKQGADFHQMVHRFILGIPAERLTQSAAGGNLAQWWEDFLGAMPVERSQQLFSEQMLSTELDGKRLVAKYDLIAIEEGGMIQIFDWKTSRKPAPRERMAARLQTRVYPYVLAQAGQRLAGAPIGPKNIEMHYWYASRPEQPEVFSYSQEQFQADESYLQGLITEISALGEIDDFPLAGDAKPCRFCVYRSLCDRGEAAGELGEDEFEVTPGEDFDFDFEQIEEIEF